LDQPLYDYGNSEVSHCIQRKRIEVRGTAFIEMAALLTLITLTAFEFYKIDRTSGLAMIPYIAWVTLLFSLNFSIFRNN
jgi:tryptophan-rich sensory protein